VAVAVISMLSLPAYATTVIAPGETSPPLNAEGCMTDNGGPTGDCLDGCTASCDEASNMANVSLNVSNFNIGSKFVQATTYTDFQVSGSGSEVDASVDYSIEWKGGWTLGGVFTGFNDVMSKITLSLRDITASNRLVQATTIHTQTVDGFIGIDIIDAGFGLDKGTSENSLSAKLTRGHTYRLLLTARCEGKGALNATVLLDYMLAPWGVWWNDLSVSIAPDLNERIDSLQAEIDQLRSQLENHKHIYLTGKGEGHNNTEAQTSVAIFMDDGQPDDEDIPEIITDADNGANTEPLPQPSVLLTNYPNPFNPSTTIRYSIPSREFVTIRVYNTLGQVVSTIVDSPQEAGEHEIIFDAAGLASGVYYYRLEAGAYRETRKLTLVK